MTNGKSSRAQRPLVFLLAGLLCWFCAEGIASAQKMMTSSAWRTQTIDTNIPKGTKIRVRTTEAIHPNNCGDQAIQGVVDRDVVGGYGQVLISKGAPVVLTAMSTANNQVTLVLASVVTNDELFGAKGSTFEEEEGQCIFAVTPTSASTTTQLQCAEVPADTLVTFRLNGPYVRVR
jgi:hypothetical protein